MAQEKPEHKQDPSKQECQAPVLPPAILALTHALVLTIRPEQKSSHEPPTRVSAEVILEFALGTHTSNTFASSSLWTVRRKLLPQPRRTGSWQHHVPVQRNSMKPRSCLLHPAALAAAASSCSRGTASLEAHTSQGAHRTLHLPCFIFNACRVKPALFWLSSSIPTCLTQHPRDWKAQTPAQFLCFVLRTPHSKLTASSCPLTLPPLSLHFTLCLSFLLASLFSLLSVLLNYFSSVISSSPSSTKSIWKQIS